MSHPEEHWTVIQDQIDAQESAEDAWLDDYDNYDEPDFDDDFPLYMEYNERWDDA